MFTASVDRTLPKPALYRDLSRSLASLLEGETDAVASLANASALLFEFLDGVNWCGFYLARGEELVLGPFQGKTACVRIAFGKGVCGAAAARRETVVVADVHRFPDYIACDADSRSEIVIPILQDGKLRGVLDVDSPETNRFDDDDREGLELFVRTLVASARWESPART